MLFNSYEFVLLFVPLVVAGFYLFGSVNTRLGILWLVLSSFFFYAYWRPIYLLLLLASIAFNYLFGRLIAHLRDAGDARVRFALIAGVAVNVAALGYFKYANFLVETVNQGFGSSIDLAPIVLPLAISFYTFQQISFLIDTARGDIRLPGFLNYATCVAFFPHLIAGPIVLYREILPQFAAPTLLKFDHANFATGVTFFVIGLFKKVVLADTVAQYASPVFAAAEQGMAPSLIESWGGALAYTLQLYFDFSGYCDMAIGLAFMFNIRLPINFNSPYKAVSIIDFWRRWHITLSRFLRDYLYIGLGGNRRGPARRYVNIFLTMLIGGIWHGAGWTFVVWGAMHGAYIVINHFWHVVRRHLGFDERHGVAGALTARGITLLAVIVGWVVFRAESLGSAWLILQGMTGANGVVVSPVIAELIPSATILDSIGVTVNDLPLFYGAPQAAWIAALMVIVLLAPNSQQLMGYVAPNDEAPRRPELRPPALPRWSPSRQWAVVAATAFIYTLTQMSNVSEFLYFQF
jgi:D-alanyl-lipoteichoic acid acyltransferase DltB (MBOAT superfamily)